MYITKQGLALIKRWEGCKLEAYLCPANKWTIGYGITSSAGMGPVTKGMRITQEQADDWLMKSLVKYENAVKGALARPATPAQFSAMVSLCFNIGVGNFAGSKAINKKPSSVLRRFNKGDIEGAAKAFRLWNKADVDGKLTVLSGLVNRREDEANLFLTGNAEPAGASATHTPTHTPTAPAPKPALSFWQRVGGYFRNTL